MRHGTAVLESEGEDEGETAVSGGYTKPTIVKRPPENQEGQAVKLGGASGETRRGNSTKKQVAPPNSNFAPPRKREKSKKWIEFKPGTKRKDGSRMYYPKWRRWLPGNEKKEWLGPVLDLDPMTEQEKNNYVKQQREGNKRRDKRRRGG
jgi:hypothetical protein